MLACLSAAWLPAAPTLEQLLSVPFPTDLTAWSQGNKVAWVLNERGARNVWVAEGPSYKGRRLTSYTEDDGQDIAQLAFTPDGQSVVYVKGGDFENDGSNPNPRSRPEGEEQDIWIVPFAGGPPKKVAEGNSPAISPKGDIMAFIRNGQIWTTAVEGGERPTGLIHAKHPSTSLRWSSDGAALAFVSARADHSFITVYRFAGKSVVYLDPSTDRDTQPVWSPDDRRIAFIRTAAGGRGFGGGREALTPWSIRIADAGSGVGREVWHAEPGPGSVFHPIVAESGQLMWGDGDRLAFAWERDGWAHLYSIPIDGGQASLLTPGEFEVEHVSLSPSRKEMVFSSNQDDIDRRHLWRVSLAAGSRPTAITSGEGIEWSPLEMRDGAVVFLHSDAKVPARAAVMAGGAMRDLAPETVPVGFPADSIVVPQQVILSASDGMLIHGQLFLPPGGTGGAKHPAIVFFHGGSRRQMLLGWHYMYYYSNAYGMNQYLAGKGYIVLSVNYRSGIGYGLNFREAIDYGPRGASEFNDVTGAGLYLRGRPDVDPKRIGLWGGSYGGYLTALGLARASDLFAAGVDMHGVHDWSARFRSGPGASAVAADPERERIAFESSPMASVGTWRSPVLLIHGDDDRNVAFHQTVALVEALRKQKVALEELIIPDEIHDFLTTRAWLRAYHAGADFFDRKLK